MSGPLEDKQQKSIENVENIKFSLDTQLNFMFSRFLYIFGDPGLLWAMEATEAAAIPLPMR